MNNFFSRLSIEKIVLLFLLILILIISIPIFSHVSFQTRILGRYSALYAVFLVSYVLFALGLAGALVFLPDPKVRGLLKSLASNNFLLLFISLIAAFLAGEGITRYLGGVGACGLGDPACWNKRSKVNIFNIAPGGCNRPREYSFEKGKNVFRIVGLGDSFTFGQGVELADTYLKKLETRLNRNSPGSRYEVINTGHCGFNTMNELQTLKTEGIKYHPDLVIVGFCLNDPEIEPYQLKRLLPKGIERLLKWSYFYFFVKYRVNLVLDKIQFDKNNNYYLNIYPPHNKNGWEMFEAAMKEIGRIGREQKIPILLAIIPLMEDFKNYKHARAHQLVTEIGNKSGMVVLDLLPDFVRLAEGTPDFNPSLFWANPRDAHPGVISHQTISDAIYRVITEKRLLPAETAGSLSR